MLLAVAARLLTNHRSIIIQQEASILQLGSDRRPHGQCQLLGGPAVCRGGITWNKKSGRRCCRGRCTVEQSGAG